MKVKVTPPYEGAGSFVVEAESVTSFSTYILKDGAGIPASWCEEIPEVVPEPGDICEFWCEHTGRHIARFVQKDRAMYEDDKHKAWTDCRVLARRPMGGLDAHDAIGEFYRDISEADTASAEVIAYNKFLSAILGVPYARVGE
jgi:hypothetical protein